MCCLKCLLKKCSCLKENVTNFSSFLEFSLEYNGTEDKWKVFLCLQDWSYRDIVPPVQTYSQKQRDYFGTPPARRFDLLESWGFLAEEKDQAGESLDSHHHSNGHG